MPDLYDPHVWAWFTLAGRFWIRHNNKFASTFDAGRVLRVVNDLAAIEGRPCWDRMRGERP